MSDVNAILSPAEALVRHFYSWEKRGRGWDMHDRTVRPEPAFLPFHGHFIEAPLPRDTGQRPTLLSSLGRSLGSIFRGSPTNEVRVPPVQPRPRDDPPRDLVELAIQLPQDADPSMGTCEQLLVGLGSCRKPLCFELIGDGRRIELQIVADAEDVTHLVRWLEAYFPEAAVGERRGHLFEMWQEGQGNYAEVVEFGLSHEFMLPLATHRDFKSDPYVALVAALASLQSGEIGVFQVLFEPVVHAWSGSVMRAVTFPDGSPFFDEAPDFLKQARQKIAKPLFAATVRIAASSPEEDRVWEVLRNLSSALGQYRNSAANELIPLSNDAYEGQEHFDDLLSRCTRRSGMILSSEELAALVHLPLADVRNPKLERLDGKTKAAPQSVVGHELMLGANIHNGRTTAVSLSDEQRVRHMHVIGASGTGKSTFLLNLIMQDMENGKGIGVIDPHGDLIDQIVARVPAGRIRDVVLVDPSDDEYPIGFNILSAHSDLEKTLLASDLVAIFRRFSTSWGDQMGSVLSNAVLAFLESNRGGTLSDLRRFLIEPAFRTEFLATVTDSHVLYYWTKEFKLLSGRPQAPLLTRLDTFLRPKPVRYMVSQQQNRLDIANIMDTGKIFLAKLAQGAIGEENASLLGSLFVSKFHQLTLGRQSQSESSRRLFSLYCDEFGGYVTESMAKLLSGARKFRLSLVLSHQELQQIHDEDVQSALLANAGTRICFRLGDKDAKTLSDSFASFEAEDLRNLSTGESIAKVGRSDDDFNLQTVMTKEVSLNIASEKRNAIMAHTRTTYATPRKEVEALLARETGELIEALVPKVLTKPVEPKTELAPESEMEIDKSDPVTEKAKDVRAEKAAEEPPPITPAVKPKRVKSPVPVVATMGKGGKRHKYLQHMVAQCAQQRGWRATIEMPTGKGAESIDVVLEREKRKIACEISVTSTVELELANLKKCLAAGFNEIVMVCEEAQVVNGLKREAEKGVLPEQLKGVRFMSPDEMFADERLLAEDLVPEEQIVRGYKVKVKRELQTGEETEARRRAIAEVLGRRRNK